MPGKPGAPIAPDGTCTDCGQVHQRTQTNGALAGRTHPTCAGHVTHDRATYVPGQPRTKLDQPRPCGSLRPRDAAPEWKCAAHGGSSPQVKAAREQRVAEQKAEKVLRRFGQPVDTSPTEALLDAVKWTAGYVAWLREKVASATDDLELVQRSSVSGKHEPSAWVDLLGTWHDRLVRICTEAIKAGIEERRVRIAEQQGALVADVIRKILDDLDLTPEQATRAGDVVPARLRALAS